MKLSRSRILIWLIFFTVILSGCMTTAGRLLTVRAQVCEFDQYFSVQIDRRLEVVLNEPVLLESDVYLLMDAFPTTRIESSEGMVATYIFEQLEKNTSDMKTLATRKIELELLFVPSEIGLLLAGLRSSEIPEELFESTLPVVENFSEIAQQACDTSINPFSRSVVVEIEPDILELLPARQTVISFLGSQSGYPDKGNNLTYEFRLLGTQPEQPFAKFDAGFDQSGDLLKTVEASFTRYHVSIDVPASTIRVTFSL